MPPIQLKRQNAAKVSPHAAKICPLILGITGEFAGSVIELDDSPLVIGRDPRVSHLVFSQQSSGVSKRHCTVVFDFKNRCFYLEDSWSSNGTYLVTGGYVQDGNVQNGTINPVSKIESGRKIRLAPGDRFYLSDQNQMFEVKIEVC